MGTLETPVDPPSDPEPASVVPTRSRRTLLLRWVAGISLALLLLSLFPLFAWQRQEQGVGVSLGNLHRIANGMLLYAQDWDGRPSPIASHLPGGNWQTWPQILRPYVEPRFLNSTLNPTTPGLHHPTESYPINASYALNRRLWNAFGPGAYSLDNFDLPERTALFVEAGPAWRDPLSAPKRAEERASFGLLDYGDVSDRVQGFSPYPSPHNGRLALVCVDGHAEVVKVLYYTADRATHDTLYGRIGGNIYDWNGGLPPGETDRPPRE